VASKKIKDKTCAYCRQERASEAKEVGGFNINVVHVVCERYREMVPALWRRGERGENHRETYAGPRPIGSVPLKLEGLTLDTNCLKATDELSLV
jgi:hypothetical protein